MLDNDSLPAQATFESAPLSSAFNRAWSEWLTFWQALPRTTGAPVQVAQVAEQVSQIARRLWRSAFAAVGEAQGQQAKATLFAFVGLIDEHLLFDDWAGQAAWQERPMETRLFGSRSAGDRIPVAIKKLLEARDPTLRDLGSVYLYCLILGFQGRLRNGSGPALHEKWRRSLFTFIRQRSANANDIAVQLQRPSAIAPQQLPVRRSLPDGYRLGLALGLGLLLLLGISQLFWLNIQYRVQPGIEQDRQTLATELKR
ncbi:DotU family type IV/VI secretion system protein [Pseudomonas sp. FEN]|uniref:DotU family type IV/VI secretion system protein n=1 Tax=Pseudomonas sp. FEN TaxID=2767468 RepID=UPI001749A33E|nr:DotU/TssL family secretion system protein [Pseudomonas sp. FEN]